MTCVSSLAYILTVVHTLSQSTPITSCYVTFHTEVHTELLSESFLFPRLSVLWISTESFPAVIVKVFRRKSVMEEPLAFSSRSRRLIQGRAIEVLTNKCLQIMAVWTVNQLSGASPRHLAETRRKIGSFACDHRTNFDTNLDYYYCTPSR